MKQNLSEVCIELENEIFRICGILAPQNTGTFYNKLLSKVTSENSFLRYDYNIFIKSNLMRQCINRLWGRLE